MAPTLLTSTDCTGQVHLIIGSGPLASARCTRSLEVGARPILLAPSSAEFHYGVQKRIDAKGVEWVAREYATISTDEISTLGRAEWNGFADAVFVTISPYLPDTKRIAALCRSHRVPVNVADSQSLSTFTLLASYVDGPLQLGVTTSGLGCKLASRIRREIASLLPPHLGDAVARLGKLRRLMREKDNAIADPSHEEWEEDETGQSSSFNRLVSEEDWEAVKSRRIRWLSQVCEYWPLRKLASITDNDIDALMNDFTTDTQQQQQGAGGPPPPTITSRGNIILAGSGPGHPDLLTLATYKAIQSADLVLADKLVPAAVIDMIPRRAEVFIARKFPGNAERAQEELLEKGLAGLQQGKAVVRLKQGDPYIYGRGAEEYAFFLKHGFEALVLPGVTSALSAPLFSHIPATHRAASDQVLICTGTGRKGAAPNPPTYQPNQSVVFLMALHRLTALVESLTTPSTSKSESEQKTESPFTPWPKETPCAVIERASCPDQRVVRTTLEYVCRAVEEEGSRPPGLLFMGAACSVLKPLAKGMRWCTEEGFRGLEGLDGSGWAGAGAVAVAVKDA